MTPVALALAAQKGFRSFGIFSHGFLAGLAFWQLVMVSEGETKSNTSNAKIEEVPFIYVQQVYVLSDGRFSEDYGPIDFVILYSPLAQPLQCVFYLLSVVCTISILDRYD